jgi:hypothetical protein
MLLCLSEKVAQKAKNMISIYQKNNRLPYLLGLLLCVLFVSAPILSFAQDADRGVTLSVTPTLFEMAASPGQEWNSSIKVINNNPHELTVYANVVNFAPQGETGEGKFIPVFEKGTDGTTLAEWIEAPQEAITIAPEQSYSIPISVRVPIDATPGGHFAAILIGTQPPETGDAFRVRTSQIVTSLFFLRIAGDVVEKGTIREFRSSKLFVNAPEADFEVRFENKGNVHLQPQGEIVITNMWGKERGVIPINHQTHFGNVLPDSVRKFDFSWKGESSISDIGRYKATLTLAYGESDRKFVTSATYFYVVPLKALSIVLGSILIFGFLVSFMIKAYVRRMLLLAGVEPQHVRRDEKRSFAREGDVRIVKGMSLKAPVQKGVLDLKDTLRGASAFVGRIRALYRFIVAYRVFFGGVVVVVMALVLGGIFLSEVTTEQKDYEVVIDNIDTDVTLSSEEIIYDRMTDDKEAEAVTEAIVSEDEQSYELTIVNSSDIPGAAASLQGVLEEAGYLVADLRSDFSESKEKSVIVYDFALQEEALLLSKKLGGALLSANPESSSENTTPPITIFIGNDYTSI